MEKHFSIRKMTEADYSTVYQLIRTAFETAEHRDGTEQDFAADLRNGSNYIPALDLVAEVGGRLCGHIMFTKTYVSQPDGSRYDTLLVAPLSVLLEHRGRGVGAALMEAGFRAAQALGYESAFLVGDPDYYQRFGYRLSHLYGIVHESMPAQYVMAKELLPGALSGVTGVVAM